MSIESARLFITRMRTDSDFAQKINSCKDFGTRWALIRADGFNFTAEEIHAAEDDLRDDELEQVSGGRRSVEWKDIIKM